MAEGRDGPVGLLDDPDAIERAKEPASTDDRWTAAGSIADTSGDDVRLYLEQLDDDRPWAASAALTYLTLLMEPTARPDDAPRPKSGRHRRPGPLLAGLWYAGERELFDDGVDAGRPCSDPTHTGPAHPGRARPDATGVRTARAGAAIRSRER